MQAVGYKHSREDIVQAAVDVALDVGMAKLTFAAVAARAGISDRMVVYYLPTKSALINATARQLGSELQALLADAFGEQRRPPADLFRIAWPVLTSATADPVFRVFLEIVGLAAAGTEPFDQLAPTMIAAWASWLADRTEGTTAAVRHRAALGVIAQLDGLLILRHTVGADAAAQAARTLGAR